MQKICSRTILATAWHSAPPEPAAVCQVGVGFAHKASEAWSCGWQGLWGRQIGHPDRLASIPSNRYLCGWG
ncbi:hypothetical protein [Budvicia aquatica]|uniref:Uncharacterized protein n=1 Tax=Budvicia aquatica TaxID=82979 RepID=A0A484ZUA0_9GAMM|nr:hypothetical protein [Budvicia aquatica]VFS51974.1 Uncharacterised protein [Budvicia aquatica]